MDYMRECAQLTQRYLKEVKHQELTINAILSRPHWKQTWIWWMALEHYEGKPILMTLEECKKIYGD